MLLAISVALAFLCLGITAGSPSVVCAAQIYGQPNPADVNNVLSAVPYAKLDPENQANAARVFAEPSFFSPRFQPLENKWQTSMVQLPLVWRYSRYIPQ